MQLVLMAVELTEDCPCWFLVCAFCPSRTFNNQLKYFKDWKKSSGNSLESKVEGPEKKRLQLVNSHSAEICILQQISA